MAEQADPSVLPELYRKTKPPNPETIRHMEEKQAGIISTKALHLDRDWRVWIDLDSTVKLVAINVRAGRGGVPIATEKKTTILTVTGVQ
jgi:hypothetical protein